MYTIKMAAPKVASTVTLRSGEKREFCHQIQCADSKISHEKLRESLGVVQKEVNDFLTEQVNLEKGASKHPNSGDLSDSVEDEGTC